MTTAKRSLYALAERLGVFVCDIEKRMPLREYNGWLAYFDKGTADEIPEKVATDEELKRFFSQ